MAKSSYLERIVQVPKLVALVLVVGVLAAAVVMFFPTAAQKSLVAYYPNTISLYEGNEVRVLGVRVGEVTEIEPAGTNVRVEMTYDAEVDVPADAEAVIISPALVGDRYVQLTPVYSGGEVMADGVELGVDRTAEPLELDQIFQTVDDLAVALGPEGANDDGSLDRLLGVLANNLDGQGELINQTITDLGTLTTTLDNNDEELFSTVGQLQRFTSNLAENDQLVRDFNQNLALTAEFLEGERDDLTAALQALNVALAEVTTFVAENRSTLRTNIDGLTEISTTLVNRRAELEQILEIIPTALSNLALAYNPAVGTIDVRANLMFNIDQLLGDPSAVLCSLLTQAGVAGQEPGCAALTDLLGGVGGLTETLQNLDPGALQGLLEGLGLPTTGLGRAVPEIGGPR